MYAGPMHQMRKEVAIHIGECYASREPTVIRTLLGSCVAVCLYDLVTGIGGMNHILLPGKTDFAHYDTPTRYAINAMELLINQIMTLGGKRHRLLAKVFGGGHIVRSASEELRMGKKNIAFVLEFLRIENICIVARDLGGFNSRRIYFQTDTGDVLLRRIASGNRGLARTENQYLKQLQARYSRPGTSDLFWPEKE